MNPLPLSTNLFTLLEELGLHHLDVKAARTSAGLFISDECRTEVSKIRPTEDLHNTYAKLKMLESEGLQVVSKLGFCSFPLRGTDGLFEIRKNGVRIYGCRIATISSSLELLALLGAEQKAGKFEASKTLLTRCQARELEIQTAWKQAGQLSNNDVEHARISRSNKAQRKR